MNKQTFLNHFLNFLSVILGVSLAFYLNDYSANKKLENDRSVFLKSLYEELETDIQVYENYQIPKNQAQVEALDSCITLLQSKSFKDANTFNLRKAIGYSSYRPNKVVFEAITQSGNINLIEDFELQSELVVYYKVLSEEAEFRGLTQVKFSEDKLMSWILDNTSLVNPEIEDLYSSPFINRLVVYRGLVSNKLAQYQKLVVRGKELQSSINQYLADE